MKKQHFYTVPTPLRTAADVMSAKMAEVFTRHGNPVQHHYLWPVAGSVGLMKTPLARVGGVKVYAAAAILKTALHLARMKPSDVIWVLGHFSIRGANAILEEKIAGKKCVYIFGLQDDWLSIPAMREATCKRIALAKATMVPTAELKERVHQHMPGAAVVVLEEPIDTGRINCAPEKRSQEPTVVWTGHPQYADELVAIGPQLARVHKTSPFKLKVIVGHMRPELDLGLPYEWQPYSYAMESALLEDAWVALAPQRDSLYAQCKGFYKIKTYLAAGIPPLANPIGHIKKMINDGQNGFIIRQDSDWENVLRELLQNPDTVRRISANCRATAESRYSYTAVMPSWTDFMRTL